MIVEFDKSKFESEREKMSERQRRRTKGSDSLLTDSSRYVVFAVYCKFSSSISRPGYILHPPKGYSPLLYYSGFFEIIDPRLSKFWIMHDTSTPIDGKPRDNRPKLAFPEWEDGFLNSLIDDGPYGSAGEVFSDYEKKMKLEYPRSDVRNDLMQLEDCWVMCPDCTESWQSDPAYGLTECQGCWRTFVNPCWQAAAQNIVDKTHHGTENRQSDDQGGDGL